MPVQFTCPACGKSLRGPEKLVGKTTKCPACGRMLVVPGGPVQSPPARRPEQHSPARPPPAIPAQPQAFVPPAPPRQADPEVAAPAAPPLPPSPIPPAASPPPEPVPAPAPAAAGSPFAIDCLRAPIFGVRELDTVGLLVLILGIVNLLSYGITFVLTQLLGDSPVLLVLLVPILLVLALLYWGYVSRYMLEVVKGAIQGRAEGPGLPDWCWGQVMLTLRVLGLYLVYALPLITIPLLPLGWLALAHTNDGRAYNVFWAFRAAARQPLRLLALWGFLLAWSFACSAVVMLLLVLLSLLMVGAAGASGTAATAAMWAVRLIFGGAIAIVCLLSGAVGSRCIGEFGRHCPEVLGMLPSRRDGAVTFGFLAGGVVAALMIQGMLLVAAGLVGGMLPVTRMLSRAFRQSSSWSRNAAPRDVSSPPRANVPPAPHPPQISPGDEVRRRQAEKYSRARQQLARLCQACGQFVREHPDRLPQAMSDLAEIDPGLTPLRSPGEPGKEYAFPGTAWNRNPKDLVLYDPAGYGESGEMLAVQADGFLSVIEGAAFRKALQDQAGRWQAARQRTEQARREMTRLGEELRLLAGKGEGFFPASLSLVSQQAANKSGLPSAEDLSRSFTVASGQRLDSPPNNLVLFDQRVYANRKGGSSYLALHVDGSVTEHATARDLFAQVTSQTRADIARTPPASSPVAGTTQPRGPRRPARAFGNVAWDVPNSSEPPPTRTASLLVRFCDMVRQIGSGSGAALVGVRIGPEAAARTDAAYARQKDEAGRYLDMLARSEFPTSAARSAATQTFNGVEYERVTLAKDGKVLTTLTGLENGRCVTYWYSGPQPTFQAFTAVLGKAKLKE